MMREREGFRSIPYAMEAQLRALPIGQRSILISLAFDAAWEPVDIDVRGVRVRLDVGEAMIGYEALARDLRVSVGLVRRAIASGSRIGLITARRAIPKVGTPPDTPCDTYSGTPYGTPPTVVRFLRHREILWPTEKRGTPCDTPPGTPRDRGGDTIPVDQQSRRSVDTLPSPSARARSQRPKGLAPTLPSDGAHSALTERLCATFAEVKGVPYAFNGGRDGKAVADLLRLSKGDIDDVDRRWRRALSLGDRWPGCSEVAQLPGKWNTLAPTIDANGYTSTGKRRVVAEVSDFADPKVRSWKPS
jgi:hypothetical protein